PEQAECKPLPPDSPYWDHPAMHGGTRGLHFRWWHFNQKPYPDCTCFPLGWMEACHHLEAHHGLPEAPHGHKRHYTTNERVSRVFAKPLERLFLPRANIGGALDALNIYEICSLILSS